MNRTCFVVFLSLTLCSASLASAETLEWIRQFGTSSYDSSHSVSADGLGSVYISGNTIGSLEGTNAGGRDVFISKYDASGTLEWTRQLGTSEDDWDSYVSADGLGSVYISGHTNGSLEGTSAGERDAFLSKYDESGTLQWTRQFGSSEWDIGFGVSADGLGCVYISGKTGGSLGGANAGGEDAFVSKYDASGTLKWIRQLGTSSEDRGSAVSADGLGNVYITGSTGGILGGTNYGSGDAFLSKYDTSGTLEWTRQLGTSENDSGAAVSTDGLGNVYISGTTWGSLAGTNAGRQDVFISKYDTSGTLEWTRQFGISGWDTAPDVSADGLGSVYITGMTRENLSVGGTDPGDFDAFIRKYDASGTLQWIRQFGTSERDRGWGVSADGLGSVYISGDTNGTLVGTGAGRTDAFVAKFTDLLLGDANLDGEVNGLDVDPFVEVLLSGPYQPEADMNEDQVVNGLDVDPFVAAVVGGAHSIPEPSTLLLCIALGVVGAWRKWGV